VNHFLEVHNPSVVVVLSREYNVVQISGVGVRNGVLMSIPAAIAEIEAAHESYLTIDQAKLFVMCPV
jgi:hypothetical protein